MASRIWTIWGDGLLAAGKAVSGIAVTIEKPTEEIIFDHWSETISRALKSQDRANWQALAREAKIAQLAKGPLAFHRFSDTVVEGLIWGRKN